MHFKKIIFASILAMHFNFYLNHKKEFVKVCKTNGFYLSFFKNYDQMTGTRFTLYSNFFGKGFYINHIDSLQFFLHFSCRWRTRDVETVTVHIL